MKSSGSPTMRPVYFELVTVLLISSIAYIGIRNGPFLHDDNPAIAKNPDVKGNTAFTKLWVNDFWGVRLLNHTSHKSYRPLTVIFFRGIHSVWELNTTAYHVANIIVHAVASALLVLVCRKVVFHDTHKRAPIVTGLLFALHPIHTEAVCGVVGCAELLSAICCMMAMLIYPGPQNTPEDAQEILNEEATQSHEMLNLNRSESNGNSTLRQRRKTKQKSKNSKRANEKGTELLLTNQNSSISKETRDSSYLLTSLIFATAAMLCKESGLSIIGVLITYEAISAMKRNDPYNGLFAWIDGKFMRRIIFMFIWAGVMVFFRMWMMNWVQPTFDLPDNLASREKERLTRYLTYFSLYWVNFRLLLVPINLCYDYSHKTIPLLKTLWHQRNLISLAFLFLCFSAGVKLINCIKHKSDVTKPYIMGCALLICSFLPASNLLFPVGFVVAERVLYMPSVGFIILQVLLWCKMLQRYPSKQKLFYVIMAALMIFYAVQTVKKTGDWSSKERFVRSGMDVNPNNPKIRYNWANFLRDNNRKEEAVTEYEITLELYPGYFRAMNNLATILEEKEETMQRAKELYVRCIEERPYNENSYHNLAKILMRLSQYDEAVKVMIRAIDKIPVPLPNMPITIRSLIHRQKDAEAERVYQRLLNKTCLQNVNNHKYVPATCPMMYQSALSDYAGILLKKGQVNTSLDILHRSTKMNPRCPDTMVKLAKTLAALGKVKEASDVILRAVHLDKGKANDLWQFASSLFRAKRYDEGVILYKVLAGILPDNFDAVGQYAATLSQTGQYEEAEKLLLEIKTKDKKCGSAIACRNLAFLYQKLKRFPEAINVIKSCLDRRGKLEGDDKHEKQTRAQILTDLAKVKRDRSTQLRETGNNKEATTMLNDALQDIKEAIKLDPTYQEPQGLLKILERK